MRHTGSPKKRTVHKKKAKVKLTTCRHLLGAAHCPAPYFNKLEKINTKAHNILNYGKMRKKEEEMVFIGDSHQLSHYCKLNYLTKELSRASGHTKNIS